MTDTDVEKERALILIGEWGTGEQVERVEGFPGLSITDCFPEHLLNKRYDRTYITSLVYVPLFGFGPGIDTLGAYFLNLVPEGWTVVDHWQAGEAECPECGDSYTGEDYPRPDVCRLCGAEKGDEYGRVIYDGEEMHVVVYERKETDND